MKEWGLWLVQIRLWEGAALNPGMGPGEQGLNGVSAPTHPFGWMLLCSERIAPLHRVALMVAQANICREGIIFLGAIINHTQILGQNLPSSVTWG